MARSFTGQNIDTIKDGRVYNVATLVEVMTLDDDGINDAFTEGSEIELSTHSPDTAPVGQYWRNNEDAAHASEYNLSVATPNYVYYDAAASSSVAPAELVHITSSSPDGFIQAVMIPWDNGTEASRPGIRFRVVDPDSATPDFYWLELDSNLNRVNLVRYTGGSPSTVAAIAQDINSEHRCLLGVKFVGDEFDIYFNNANIGSYTNTIPALSSSNVIGLGFNTIDSDGDGTGTYPSEVDNGKSKILHFEFNPTQRFSDRSYGLPERYFYDTFTDESAATAIASHAPNINRFGETAWQTEGGGLVTVHADGYAYWNGTDVQDGDEASYAPILSTDGFVQATITPYNSGVTLRAPALGYRFNQFNDMGLFTYLDCESNQIVTRREEGDGTINAVDTRAFTCASGTAYVLRITFIGNALTIYVDGVQQGDPITNTFHQTDGEAVALKWVITDTGGAVTDSTVKNFSAGPLTHYDNRISEGGVSSVTQDGVAGGGLFKLNSTSVNLVNQDKFGVRADAIDYYRGAHITISAIFIDGKETDLDKVQIFKGKVVDVQWAEDNITLNAEPTMLDDFRRFPNDIIDLASYPNAPMDNYGKPIPVVFGSWQGFARHKGRAIDSPVDDLLAPMLMYDVFDRKWGIYGKDLANEDVTESMFFESGKRAREFLGASMYTQGEEEHKTYLQVTGVERNVFLKPFMEHSDTSNYFSSGPYGVESWGQFANDDPDTYLEFGHREDTGTATGGDFTSVPNPDEGQCEDTSKNWTVNQWVGATLIVLDVSDGGTQRPADPVANPMVILSNTSDTLTFTIPHGPDAFSCAASDTYTISLDPVIALRFSSTEVLGPIKDNGVKLWATVDGNTYTYLDWNLYLDTTSSVYDGKTLLDESQATSLRAPDDKFSSSAITIADWSDWDFSRLIFKINRGSSDRGIGDPPAYGNGTKIYAIWLEVEYYSSEYFDTQTPFYLHTDGYSDKAYRYADGSVISSDGVFLENPSHIFEAIMRDRVIGMGLTESRLNSTAIDAAQVDTGGTYLAYQVPDGDYLNDKLSFVLTEATADNEGTRSWLDTYLRQANLAAWLDHENKWNLNFLDKNTTIATSYLHKWNTASITVEPPAPFYNEYFIKYAYVPTVGDYTKYKAATGRFIVSGYKGALSSSVLTDSGGDFLNKGLIPGSNVYIRSGKGSTSGVYTIGSLTATTLTLDEDPGNSSTSVEYYAGSNLNADCVESFLNYGTIEPFPEDQSELKFVIDEATASNYLTNKIDYHVNIKSRIRVTTFFNAIGMEPRDLVYVHNDMLPISTAAVGAGTNQNAQLNGALNNSATSFNYDGSTISATQAILIDDELIFVISRTPSQITNCTRGYKGTKAEAHDDDVFIKELVTGWEVLSISTNIQSNTPMELTLRELGVASVVLTVWRFDFSVRTHSMYLPLL